MENEGFTEWSEVAARVTLARERAGFSQSQLAERIGMSRPSLTRVEQGTRRIDVLELVRLARATGRSVQWFVSRAPLTFASHRVGPGAGHDVTALEDHLERTALDVELLADIGVLALPPACEPWGVTSLDEAEAGAVRARRAIGVPTGPLPDLQQAVQRLGLLAFSLDLGPDTIDGGYVRVGDVGVALVNGATDPGRRRFTLAHELGHHLLADEYTVDVGIGATREEREALINAFAIHLLLPRASVVSRWKELSADHAEVRTRLVALAAEYRVSWTAMVAHACTLGLVDRRTHEALRAGRPVAGDFVEVGATMVEELVPVSLPTDYGRAVVKGYRRGLLGAARAVELMHGTLTREGLPQPAETPLESLAGDFEELG